MGTYLSAACYAAYAAFLVRFIMHALVWRRAAETLRGPGARSRVKACAWTVMDVVLLFRVMNVNPALWIGAWTFHVSLLVVLLRHLRYLLDPVPLWVWWLQTPGLIGGYVLPFSAAYILIVRLLTRHEKFTSSANLFLLTLVLLISALGVIMHAWYKPDLVAVKLFALGVLSFRPAPAPAGLLFGMHVVLALVLVPLLPTHLVAAPFVLMEARKRDQALRLVLHEK